MDENALYSGQSMDGWKPIEKWTIFWWTKNHCKVDSLWMDEKPLQSGQSSHGRKTIAKLTIFGRLENVFDSKHKHSTDETDSFFVWGGGVKRHVQDTQHKTSARTPNYCITAKPRLLLFRPVFLVSASRRYADRSWQFCLGQCGVVAECRSPSIQTSSVQFMRHLNFLVWWLLDIPPDFNTEQFLHISRAIALRGHSNTFIAMHWTIQLFFRWKFCSVIELILFRKNGFQIRNTVKIPTEALRFN